MSDHEIKSGVSNDAYREGWERIFGKKKRGKEATNEVIKKHRKTLERRNDE